MIDKVRAYIKEHSLIGEGTGVLAAVSGGADSVAMLIALKELASELHFTLYAAHLDHGIRGEAAKADADYVSSLCEKLGVECERGHADVPALARENSHTLEQEARIVRYEFLRRAKERFGAKTIAVAHHMDDQAESILMHLSRGSGLLGLTGMRAKRDDIIRPMLSVRRAEIEAFLASRGVSYQTDLTNLDRDATRNRFRLDVIPYLERHVNSALVPSLCSASELISRDEDYLSGVARRELEAARLQGGGFDRAKLAALDMPIKTRAIRLALADIGAVVDIERFHVERVAKLLTGRTGARLNLHQADVWTSYGAVYFARPGAAQAGAAETDSVSFLATLKVPGDTVTPWGVFTSQVLSGAHISRDPYTATFDYEDTPPVLTVRKRLPGDKFHALGAPGTKKLKDYFIDKKTPRDMRDVPLVVTLSRVLFIPGETVSDDVKVTDASTRTLRIKYTKDK